VPVSLQEMMMTSISSGEVEGRYSSYERNLFAVKHDTDLGSCRMPI
jgi:hypothetical protein